jgi:hypothetical protein
MLQAHSLLWHYLWLAPHVLQLGLGIVIWRQRLYERFPIFFTYVIFESLEEFTLYTMDVVPLGSDAAFWAVFRVGLIIEGLLKIGLIAELFRHLVAQWPAVAILGNRLISGLGALLVIFAALIAAYSPVDNPQFAIVSRVHVLEQTFYIVQCGLILFLFLFGAYYKLSWNHRAFGIAVGFGVVACEHMAAWAVMASGAMLDKRHLLDLLNMATYHLCVLIWCYYLLVPQKKATTSAVALPENDLAIWNRELERLLQR